MTRVLFIVPSPSTPGLTEAERVALTLRRDATVTGRCACGATMLRANVEKGAVVPAAIVHEDDCPAADGPHIRRMVDRLGDRLRWDYVVAEVDLAA